MKPRVTIILSGLIIISTVSAYAVGHRSAERSKPAVASPSQPTVDVILNKYVQALGGVQAYKKLTTRIIKGTMERLGEDNTAIFTAEFTVYSQSPNKSVMIGQAQVKGFGMLDISQGYNGKVGWSLNLSESGFRELMGAELEKKKLDVDFYRPIKLKELYPRITYKGIEKIAEGETYLLEAGPPGDGAEKWYFDTNTGLLVRSDSKENSDNVWYEKYYEDYRAVGGIKIPFVTRSSSISSKSRDVIKYTDVRHNIPIDDGKFDLY
jgi:hypothetical protein